MPCALLMLVGMAGLGYCISMPPAATVAHQWRAVSRRIAPTVRFASFHSSDRDTSLRDSDPDFRASANAAKAMHEGTIGE